VRRRRTVAAPPEGITFVRKLSVLAAIGVPLLALGAGGAAWAAWGIQGSGSSRAQAGTAVPLNVSSATISPTTRLYPGGTADMLIKVRNDNHFPVTISFVVRTSKPITVDSGHAACPVAVLDTTEADDTFDVSWHLTAGQEQTFTLPNALVMAASAPNACQGASFAIPITITAASG
jgi:hypothetical protein